MTDRVDMPDPVARVSGSGKGWVERGVGALALVAGYCLLVQAVVTTIEIVGRKLFSFSFQGVDELGGYALAITASLGFGYTTIMRGHTRVDVLLRILARPVRAALHVLAVVVMAAISVAMLWYAFNALTESLEYGAIANSPLETPIWIPQGLWLAGFAVFALVSLLALVRIARLVQQRDVVAIDREFGMPSVDEEIAESLDEPTTIHS